MKVGTKVIVTRFNGEKIKGAVVGAARVGGRGAWYPVRFEGDSEPTMCRLGQLKAL
jgi:hypothetical protein